MDPGRPSAPASCAFCVPHGGQRCRAVSMAALIAMAAPSTDGRRGIAGRIRGGAGHGGAHEREDGHRAGISATASSGTSRNGATAVMAMGGRGSSAEQ